ncbi:MAG: zinc ABC transporter substrate-binding protein, partial [Chloroflexi bacterium]|nr:zinc ABC transporter substrate-binding protein [Chloroflexota bacterium]
VEAANAEAAVPFEEGEDAHEDEHAHEDEDEHGHEDEHAHEDEDEHAHEDEHGHAHGEFDPHFWLDPLRAITQAERIAGTLIEADPEGADVYRANLATLSSELRALHAEFEAGLSSCVHREFVTSHAAYGYLALAYDLEQVPVAGLSPDAEPSPQRLASIADRINDLGLGAILVEPVLSGSYEQVLAAETGASIYTIHPMDGITQAELDEHGDYFGLMRDNLKSLRAAMECS